jgi:hypothetical protein
MDGIDFKIKATGIDQMSEFLLAMAGKADRPVAVALTRTGKLAQQAARETAQRHIEGGPTTWTMRGVFLKPATVGKLQVSVGFNDWSGKGVPVAEYLQPIAAGGIRRPKPFEGLLRRAGKLGGSQFAVPSGLAPGKLDSKGNLPGAEYQRILSRLKASREIGSTQNATGSKRSRSKQRALTYFVGGSPSNRGIYARQAGSRKITPIFHFIDRAPSYRPSFPIARVLQDTFNRNWSEQFEFAIQQEMNYWKRKGR